MGFLSEKDLENAAVPFLNEFLAYYVWQLPLYNRVVDLVGLDHDGHLIAIEFKLRDWKRALRQAARNSNAFDYVYVLLPSGRYREKLVLEAGRLGVGVLLHDVSRGSTEVALRAQRISRQWRPNVDYVRKVLQLGRKAS